VDKLFILIRVECLQCLLYNLHSCQTTSFLFSYCRDMLSVFVSVSPSRRMQCIAARKRKGSFLCACHEGMGGGGVITPLSLLPHHYLEVGGRPCSHCYTPPCMQLLVTSEQEVEWPPTASQEKFFSPPGIKPKYLFIHSIAIATTVYSIVTPVL
jgi:hypothetical protein